MADDRSTVRLKPDPTYEGIEREIAQALAVEPSPEFLARVRMRVASEPVPRRAWWMPVLVGATAIAAAVTFALVAPWRGAQVQLKLDSTTSPETRDKTLPVAAVASGFSRTKTSLAEGQVRLKPDPTEFVATEGVGSGFSRTKATEPQVLIAQDEASSSRRMYWPLSTPRKPICCRPRSRFCRSRSIRSFHQLTEKKGCVSDEESHHARFSPRARVGS